MYGFEALVRTENTLRESLLLKFAKEISRDHHEKWNGSGYPHGLKGNDIPISARVMAVADVYDALMSKRPYKEPISHTETLQIIKDGAGQHFDPMVVKAFLENHEEFNNIAKKFKDENSDNNKGGIYNEFI